MENKDIKANIHIYSKGNEMKCKIRKTTSNGLLEGMGLFTKILLENGIPEQILHEVINTASSEFRKNNNKNIVTIDFINFLKQYKESKE